MIVDVLAAPAAAGVAADRLPAAPRSWYFVCRSRQLRARRIITWNLLGSEIVLFRNAVGQPAALDAHCAHMGAHLGHAEVIGDRLRCAMHHWMVDAHGQCRGPRGACLQQRIYPVVERYGAVFVFAGAQADFAFPSFGESPSEPVRVLAGASEVVHTSWPAICANAFDTSHILAVHGRALRQPPEVSSLGPHGLELRYTSRVTGKGISDRCMRLLSNDTIRVTIRCWGGTILTVRSEVGSRRGRLLFAVRPAKDRVLVTPFVGVPRNRIPGCDFAAARLSLWLFTTFLRRDLIPLRGFAFRLDGALQSGSPAADLTRWLQTLPAAAIGSAAG